MEALSAFITIVSIIAIVLVVGGLIAFIGHMIIGAFDGANRQSTKSESRNVLDYSQYKQLENSKQAAYTDEYNFEAINASKAEKEKQMLENEKDTIFELEADKDDELEEIENRLKETKEEVKAEPKVEEVVPAVEKVEEPKEEINAEEDDDDLDLDEMLNEISDEVIEEEKAETETEIKMSEELESYSIDDLLKQAEEESNLELEEELDEDDEDVDFDETEEDEEDVEEEKEEPVEEKKVENSIKYLPQLDERTTEIAELKAQLAELNKQLELARETKVEVVKIDVTEEECVQKIEMLEERLKNVKKDYKVNLKEYKPLKKVMNDLERYQTKLRRKEAIVAKKKVALYGVNNYVDIDKEKAEKLANELELLDGLRLSVSHCEEVINANKDRFPILEHTNQILEDQIAHIETDIAQAQETLKKIREKNGNGEGNNEGNK